MSPVDRVLQHAMTGPPRLGRARLVCVDGPSGSGKTTLAEALLAREPRAQLLHVDEMLPGWDGVPEIPGVVLRTLGPLAQGRDGWWRRWDWPGHRWAEWHRVRPGGLVVLEGVGTGDRSWSRWTDTLVWVEAPRSLRLARGVERNDGMDEHWRRWQVREDALFVRERTRSRADVVVPAW